MASSIPPPNAQERKALDFADAALGAAGHQVTDPASRERALLIVRDQLTPEQAIQQEIDRIATKGR